MAGFEHAGFLAMSLGCFGLTIASAIFPWLNTEIIVLSLPALARSPAELAWFVGIAVAGHLVGKCGVYWAARRGTARPPSQLAPVVARWRMRMEGRPWAPAACLLLSATTGVPPFYLITLLAGATRVNFPSYVACGAAGLLVRFGSLALVPHLVTERLR
jgi:membrane protein YqaA with SNARE-associated domain